MPINALRSVLEVVVEGDVNMVDQVESSVKLTRTSDGRLWVSYVVVLGDVAYHQDQRQFDIERDMTRWWWDFL